VVRDRTNSYGISIKNPFSLRQQTREWAKRATMVCCSQYIANSLYDAGVRRQKVRVIYPISPPELRPCTPLPTTTTLAFVGQLLRGKGVDLLLQAMVHLPETTLLIAGEGNGRAGLEALAYRLGLGARVQFLGQVAPEQTSTVYDQARVVVVPSRWPEPFGMIGIEAMRRERLVVAARHGGISEWLAPTTTEHGFAPGQIPDLVRALRRALYRTDGEKIALEARRWVEQTFTFATMTTQVESMLMDRTGPGTTLRGLIF